MNKVVICLHGLGRTRFSMRYLCRRIKHAGYKTLLFGYNSRKAKLKDLGMEFSEYISRTVQDDSHVSFVGHSLGCLLIRAAIENQEHRDLLAERNINFERAVFLGPPNRGAELARKLQGKKVSGFILGPVLDDIASLDMKEEVPDCEVGVIAGGRKRSRGYNPFVSGDNDGIVRVAETHLEGAKEHIIVNCPHTVMMWHPRIIELTLSFLKVGSFNQIAL